jgi:hypothetical protein
LAYLGRKQHNNGYKQGFEKPALVETNDQAGGNDANVNPRLRASEHEIRIACLTAASRLYSGVENPDDSVRNVVHAANVFLSFIREGKNARTRYDPQ